MMLNRCSVDECILVVLLAITNYNLAVIALEACCVVNAML